MKKRLLILMNAALMTAGAQTFNCGDTLLDTRDGKKYPTVLIGTQCWMKANLNYGTAVPSVTSGVTHSDQFNNSIPEKYAAMGNTVNLATHGGLYEWNELMSYTSTAGGQGLCPNGWHVPTDAEFQTMIVTAGGTVTPGAGGNKLKATGTGVGGGMGTNTSSFSALPAGDRDAFGIFYGLGNRYIFWTSTETSTAGAYHYTLWNSNDTIERMITQKYTGLSCRCVKNAGTGLNEKVGKMDMYHLYPNPVHDKFALVMNSGYENAGYVLYNLLGEAVKQEEIVSSTTFISVADLNEGIYILKVRKGIEMTERKIVVTK